MDFSYTEEQLELKKLADQILTDLGKPERLKALEKDGPYLDTALWQQLVDSGIHNASLPESVGGLGMDFLATTLVCEALGQSATMTPFIACIVSTALPLLRHCDDPLANIQVKAIAEGRQLVTTALIEPRNENPFAPGMKAYHNNDQWYLSGAKHCIPYAEQSQHILLFARAGKELWAGFARPQAPGCYIESQLATVPEPQSLFAAEGGAGYCLARGEAAEQLLAASVAMTTVAYCAMAVGVADRMTRIAAEYTSQREQFGVPIATFQALAHRLADCYIDTECLRIMVQKAACDVNEGHYQSDAIHMAKIWCGDVMHRVSQATQHVHGGAGIDRDYHLFRFCLWAKQLELALGGSRVHLATLADRLAARYTRRTGA